MEKESPNNAKFPESSQDNNTETEYFGKIAGGFDHIRDILVNMPREVRNIEEVQQMLVQTQELSEMFTNMGLGNIRNRFKSSHQPKNSVK